MPEFDFASMVEEKEPYRIVLSHKRDEAGDPVLDDSGKPVPDDLVVLPKVIPGKLMLTFWDMDRKDLKKMENSPREVFKMGMDVVEALIGKDKWDHVISTIGIENVEPLIIDIFGYYGIGSESGTEGESEAEGKEETEAEESPSPSTTSSTTGEHSTPTSNGSTQRAGELSTPTNSDGEDSSQESLISPPSPSS